MRRRKTKSIVSKIDEVSCEPDPSQPPLDASLVEESEAMKLAKVF
jgi:hypothetical protein